MENNKPYNKNKPSIRYYHCITDGGNHLLLVSRKSNTYIDWSGAYLTRDGNFIRPVVRGYQEYKYSQTWTYPPKVIQYEDYKLLIERVNPVERWMIEHNVSSLRLKKINGRNGSTHMLIQRKIKKAMPIVPTKEILKVFCVFMRKYKNVGRRNNNTNVVEKKNQAVS